MVTKKLEYVPIIWLQGQKTLYFWPKNQFFPTLRPYNPLFWPQTDSAQWDHIFPISSGNSGYLRFSGRCPFGRSAGRFLAPIAQNGPFFRLKMLFFLCYAYITHFFGLRQTRLNGIIPSPYPQVTLDAFGFPVDAHLAGWRAVLWPNCQKSTLFGSKKCCLLRPKCCDLGNNKTCTGKNMPLHFCIRLTHEDHCIK